MTIFIGLTTNHARKRSMPKGSEARFFVVSLMEEAFRVLRSLIPGSLQARCRLPPMTLLTQVCNATLTIASSNICSFFKLCLHLFILLEPIKAFSNAFRSLFAVLHICPHGLDPSSRASPPRLHSNVGGTHQLFLAPPIRLANTISTLELP